MDEEKRFSVSYSASNKKTIKAGSFEVTLFEPLEKICDEVVGLAMAEVKLKDLTSLNITIKEVK